MKNGKKSESGSILIVVVAVLALVAAMTLLGVGSFHTIDNPDLVRRTKLKQEMLMAELSSYAQRTNTLPCPADPAVAPASRNFGFSRASCQTPATADGIVPFRTLNLSPYDALDGWARYMTYRLSPVLADTTTGNPNVGNQVFMRCRRFGWFDGSPVAAPFNVFPGKARFCCPPIDKIPPATDLKVYASSPALAAGTTINGVARQAVAAYYNNINTPVTDLTVPATGPQGALSPIPAAAGTEELFAAAIISHGQNGVGAYAANGTNSHLTGTGGANETVNGNGGSNVIDRPINAVAGANYFDDIVTWQTQIGLMGLLNNTACYMPWR